MSNIFFRNFSPFHFQSKNSYYIQKCRLFPFLFKTHIANRFVSQISSFQVYKFILIVYSYRGRNGVDMQANRSIHLLIPLVLSDSQRFESHIYHRCLRCSLAGYRTWSGKIQMRYSGSDSWLADLSWSIAGMENVPLNTVMLHGCPKHVLYAVDK